MITPEGQKLAGFGFWNIVPDVLATPDDVAFATTLIDTAEATLCIDTRRIYSAGHVQRWRYVGAPRLPHRRPAGRDRPGRRRQPGVHAVHP